MKRSNVIFDWQELEKDQELPPIPTSDSASGIPRSGLERPLLIGGALFLLAAAFLVSVWVMRQSQMELAQVHNELVLAVGAEIRQAENEESLDNISEIAHASTRQLQAVAVSQEKVLSVEVQSLQQDMAAVMIITKARPEDSLSEVGAATAYRQLRFYQTTDTGWQRVPVHRAHLGPVYAHETEHFRILYHALDETSVAAIAPELDAIYTELRRDYGLPSDGNRLVIELVAGSSEYEAGCSPRRQLCVLSPALTELPVELSEADALRLRLLNGLVYRVRGEALQVEAFHYTWTNTATAIARLHLRSYNERPAAWHTDLVRWFNAPGVRALESDAEVLAPELAELCAKHRIAALYPHVADITGTYLCVLAPTWDVEYLARYGPPKRLHQLVINEETEIMTATWKELLALETVLDYVVATYGREVLPSLVEGFRLNSAWNTLIPAVFDVSVEEFEAGWQMYLADMSAD